MYLAMQELLYCIAFVVSYTVANNLIPELKLEFEYLSSDEIKFKTVYDYYNITFIKCSDLNPTPATNYGMLRIIYEPQSCRKYQCNIIFDTNEIKNISRVENVATGIADVPPVRILSVTPSSNSISIRLSYTNIDCIASFYVLLDNFRAILYTSNNLTTELIVPELSPCENYQVVVLLNYQYTQYVLYDNNVKTYAVSYLPVKNIKYDTHTELLTWSPVIVLGCDAVYQIAIQSTIDGIKNDLLVAESKRTEYQLRYLPKCVQYLVSITPKGFSGLTNTIVIENKELTAVGPVSSLTVDLIDDSALSIKWGRPTLHPECLTEYSLRWNNVWITTKSQNYFVTSYSRSAIYKIAVCTISKPIPRKCVNYLIDPFKNRLDEPQNVTNIEVNSNHNGTNTTISWNAEYQREHDVKYYAVRIYNTAGREIYRQNVSSTEIYVLDLNKCEEYFFYIETVSAQNLTNKIESKLTFKSKPQIPNAPEPPVLYSRRSSSITITTDYSSQTDCCQIEVYRFACSTGSQVRFTDSENRSATISNLRSNTVHYCYAMIKNEIGWSDSSAVINFETDITREYSLIELYAAQIFSKSIVLAWSTTLNSTFYLLITKINSLDTVSTDCYSEMYSKTEVVGSEFTRAHTFENLDPNTNYSIQVEASDRLKNYASQIYVITKPDIAQQVINLDVTSTFNGAISISWEAPCVVNGRIKNFIVTITATNESDTDNPVIYRNIPFDQFNYIETSLKTNHSYNISVAIKLLGFPGPLNESTIEFIFSPNLNSNRSFVYIAIGIACLVLLTIALGVTYYFRYYLSELKPNESDAMFIDLPKYSSSIQPMNNDLIRKEFQAICDMDLSHLSKSVPQNQVIKNRNSDIIPYDFNRVVLKPNDYCFTDYINASYIDGYDDVKEYIVTQGPNNDTVYDFWHMVIQEKCDKIVMLTELVENGCSQCLQYYPNANEKLEFEDLLVKNVDETKFGNFVKRSLCIVRGKMKRHVVHYQYTAWSIHNSPQFPLCLIEFVEVSGTQTNQPGSPFVVHSSTGAGRTGTFIALDILFQNCRNANKVSISQTVKKLRSQRTGMVETFAQYEFLYAAIKTYYLTRVYKRNQWG